MGKTKNQVFPDLLVGILPCLQKNLLFFVLFERKHKKSEKKRIKRVTKKRGDQKERNTKEKEKKLNQKERSLKRESKRAAKNDNLKT